MDDKIKVELSPEEINLITLFREHGIFEMSRTNVVISIAEPGVITKIDANSNLFKRKNL